jgi:hypothetical protein
MPEIAAVTNSTVSLAFPSIGLVAVAKLLAVVADVAVKGTMRYA